jgi:hypothetical protein
MPDAVKPGTFLVIGIDNMPGSLFKVGMLEHQILGPRIVHPTLARLNIHWAKFPTLDWILDTLLETPLLLLVVHRKPILDEIDARSHQLLLEHWTGAKELLIFVLVAELHHALDSGAIVPTPIEQDDFASGRKFGDVALEIPLASLTTRRRAQRDATNARV